MKASEVRLFIRGRSDVPEVFKDVEIDIKEGGWIMIWPFPVEGQYLLYPSWALKAIEIVEEEKK